MIFSSMGKQVAGAVATILFVAVVLSLVTGIGPSGVEEEKEPHMASTAAGSPQASGNKLGSVASMVKGLEAKLESNPDDAKGWLLLAKSYDFLGDGSAAWDAYERARELGMQDEQLELKLAVNLAPTSPGNWQAKDPGNE